MVWTQSQQACGCPGLLRNYAIRKYMMTNGFQPLKLCIVGILYYSVDMSTVGNLNRSFTLINEAAPRRPHSLVS